MLPLLLEFVAHFLKIHSSFTHFKDTNKRKWRSFPHGLVTLALRKQLGAIFDRLKTQILKRTDQLRDFVEEAAQSKADGNRT